MLDCINKYVRRKYPKKLVILITDDVLKENNINAFEVNLSSKDLLRREKVKAKRSLMNEIKGIKRLGNRISNFDLLRARTLHSLETFG